MFSWDDYPRYQTSSDDAPVMTPPEVVECVNQLQRIRPEAIEVRQIGRSVEGRPILLVTLGTGAKRVLAWSQMHGDEPTHTAVLLDLIHFLQRAADHPCARAVIEGCTLSLIPMLNPDGAVRGTRRNAQDIDINRDARHLQSPEGRTLQETVQEIAPHFAFNLHNQHSRTTVGRTQKMAAVSLLVPAVDPREPEIQQVATAKKMASSFLRAVEPYCPGMVSRYDADFMPRAFGEWVQQQRTATLLVEAGGWPHSSQFPLKHLHFHGLVSTLYDLATDAFLATDDVAYRELLRSGEHDLFDCLIREVTVANREGRHSEWEPFMADLGINFPGRKLVRDGRPSQGPRHEGVIQDLGDLQITTGRSVVEGRDKICLPGRIVTSPECSPLRPPSDAMVRQLLASGITSLVGQVKLADRHEVDALENLPPHAARPINIGYFASVDASTEEWSDRLRDRFLFCLSRGVLGLVAEDPPADIQNYLDWFSVPRFRPGRPLREVPECLSHLQRGTIRLGAVADLVLVKAPATKTEIVKPPESGELGDDIAWADLQQVIVGGNVAFDRGRVVDDSSGAMLSRPVGET